MENSASKNTEKNFIPVSVQDDVLESEEVLDVPKPMSKEEAEQWLVDQGVKKDEKGAWEKDAIFIAAIRGNFGVLRWLHSTLVFDAKDAQVVATVARFAATEGHLHILKFLHYTLHALDPMSLYPDTGMNLAHDAALFGQLHVLKWLKDVKMLDAKAVDLNGRNVAHYATSRAHLHVLEWLKEMNALDVTLKDNEGWSVEVLGKHHPSVQSWLDSQKRE